MARDVVLHREYKPGLPERTGDVPPKYENFWVEYLLESNLVNIPELVQRICALKAKGVTGASVAYFFFERRIQPLQRRDTLSYKYQGVTDSSWMVRDDPSVEEVMRRVTHILSDVNSKPLIPKLSSVKKSPDPVSSHNLFSSNRML